MRTIQVNDITVQVEQIGPCGHAIWDRNRFKAYSSRPLTKSEIGEIQDVMGYHPAGYDCFYVERPGYYEEKDGQYITSWSCTGSCD